MSKAKNEAPPTWTAVRVKLGDLVPWEHNPRQSTKAQAERILQSFNEFGQVQTVAVDSSLNVLDGHQRLSALLTLHGADYCIDARQSSRKLSDDERKRLVLMLHAGASGEWNWDSLSSWDASLLRSSGFDEAMLAQLNRDQAALLEMFAEAESAAAVDDVDVPVDRAEELREKWGVCSGQLWALGNHRLLCGDSTKAEDVARVMGGDCAELLFTSPPYADMREYKGGDLSVENLAGFIPAFKPFAKYQVINLGIKRDKGEVVQYWDTYIKAARDAGYKLLSWNVWDQGQNGAVGKLTAMFPIEHEWLFVFGAMVKDLLPTVPNKNAGVFDDHHSDRQADGGTVKKKAVRIRPMREIGTMTRISPQMARNLDMSHSAMFPVELPLAYIEAMTAPGDCVAEPFLGSGTMLIACEQSGRRARAIEIDPGYTAVALERWSLVTGKTPELVSEAITAQQ